MVVAAQEAALVCHQVEEPAAVVVHWEQVVVGHWGQVAVDIQRQDMQLVEFGAGLGHLVQQLPVGLKHKQVNTY